MLTIIELYFKQVNFIASKFFLDKLFFKITVLISIFLVI